MGLCYSADASWTATGRCRYRHTVSALGRRAPINFKCCGDADGRKLIIGLLAVSLVPAVWWRPLRGTGHSSDDYPEHGDTGMHQCHVLCPVEAFGRIGE